MPVSATATAELAKYKAIVTRIIGDPLRARAGIKLLNFKPFNPIDKRTEITYREEATGKLKHVTKGMTGIIIELCSRNKTEKIENHLEKDVEEYAARGLRTLAVAYEEVDGDDFEAEANHTDNLIFLSSIALVCIIKETTFFQDTFGVRLDTNFPIASNNPQLHMVIYLQVAIISQALIFVTRFHLFFFMERPLTMLMVAFCIAQLISSIIAAYGDWGFTIIRAISGGWIGIVWVWFVMKATVIKRLRQRHEAKVAQEA
ncbi:ATPase 2, plasma membrane-type [Psilocybe cubensis]|uniref:ATPase 2, plasma membrane-type n=2 Tax=Psilocybe cubensis TaxID=181762 RepID=A0ACB8HH83_PSICU|nr:ATPase 2, plasma membrane-type [Psilocybe cubensis]KAH9487194.1 ATPase 2, plasma membrane-type [Psilocybe cubensis]